MLRLSRIFLAILTFALFVNPTGAQEPIRLARTPDISPDGKLVAFSYKGDIWTVETIGGTARAVTSHPAHDISPVFSPDGRFIAFSSNRHGSYDIYIVPVQGGRPRRLSVDSASEMVCGWTPDGKNILYASTRSTAFPPSYELYLVPIEGGMSRRISAAEGKEGVLSPTGDRIAYVRGPGTWYRKGYRGSSNDEIWICNADGTNNRQVTAFNGQDGSPMWSADGKTLYYVSEIHGSQANIVRLPLEGSAKPQQVTSHKDDGVRRARISRDGQWIVYECGPDLWVVSTGKDSAPRKLAIEVNADDKSNPEQIHIFTNRATEFALSADEKYMAFAVHGKLFRRKVGPDPKVVQMTDGPSNDHSIAWAPDSKKILFVSDRNGHEDIYLLEADDPEHPNLIDAHRFKVKQISSTPEAESGLTFAPNGSRVAFLRAGKLWTMNPDGSNAKAIVPDVHVFDYDWSPDSRWIVYARRDGSFASELYIVPAAGASNLNPARNITRYATYNGDVTWSHDGKKIAFLSERREQGRQLPYVLPLQKPAAPNVNERSGFFGGSSVSIDWDDIHLRAELISPVQAWTAAISPDGSKIAFVDARDHDLWVANSNGGQLTRLTTGHVFPRQIVWSKPKSALSTMGTDLLYYLDRSGSIHLVRASGTSGPPLPFRIKMRIRTEDLYREMFDQAWRYLAEHFYDAAFHGRDWNAIKAKYRPLVQHIAMKEDLYSLLYLMLGELNASHLGIGGYLTSPDEETADLGLIFEEGYRGRGLKIAEILKRGPADRRGLSVKAGEYVLNIDGVELNEKTELSELLNGKVGETVSLQVGDKPDTPAKERKHIEIAAVSRDSTQSLMYDRWVEKNAERVSKLSNGKLGYIHIPSMDDAGLDRFLRSLYSDNFDKEGIVLDVRFNGGGFTHDKILNFLGSREHTVFKERNGGEGLVMRSSDRKWNKPLVLLINNRSYSDAEIFPSAFRTLGLGKLVGQPTGGFVIGTGATQLIDGSILRIPRVGVYTIKGVNMEKEGVTPDVLVEEHPDQLAKGIDAQLVKAVEVLQTDVVAWKQKHQGNGTNKPAEASSAANPTASPAPAVPPMPPAK
ncbi:MAG TPA: S41 family peptidase [Gemmataceae bacterium]